MPSSVNLGEVLEAFITQAVRNGRQGSRSEVLREGVRRVRQREALWARFDAEIQKGIDSIEQQGGAQPDEAMAEARGRIAEHLPERQAA